MFCGVDIIAVMTRLVCIIMNTKCIFPSSVNFSFCIMKFFVLFLFAFFHFSCMYVVLIIAIISIIKKLFVEKFVALIIK